MTAVRDTTYFMAAYQTHPKMAAKRLVSFRDQAQQARQQGDRTTAEAFEDLAAQLEAALGRLGYCRCCGHTLTDPISIERGIGSTCWRKGHR